jgi:hypothetical protein
LKVFSNGQTIKYETLEDVYNFFGLAILRETPQKNRYWKERKYLGEREGDKTQFCFWRRQQESYLSFVVAG